ncbi:MAG TPA: adenylate/guanylate cyclase domain-containing protein [Nocardioidaceae bacterium]|nr:adenylate/guanylate cyclase domain-containing protein [Nocardioidaceae bacterium]
MQESVGSLPLPEHPELRQIAVAMDAAGMLFEIHDARFRCVYMSQDSVRVGELSSEEALRQLGKSAIVRGLTEPAEIVGASEESAAVWFQHNAPIWRHYVDPADDDFEEIFGSMASHVARIEPVRSPPRAWYDRMSFPPGHGRFRRSILGDLHQVQLRVNDDEGRLIGFVYVYRGTIPDGLLHRLGRGDPRLFEGMAGVSEPARRPAAILFADLEASGVLSRRLSSRGYFELIRSVTDLIDTSVIGRNGITGKHAGDGGSALFVAAHFDGSESRTARAVIEAARAIRDGAEQLGPADVDVRMNAGVHWGATLMVGQVATSGRLEVTALGDQMNECARIETAATGGTILASKELIERLDTADAHALGIDLESIAYTTLGDLRGVSDKAIRDASSVPVVAI